MVVLLLSLALDASSEGSSLSMVYVPPVTKRCFAFLIKNCKSCCIYSLLSLVDTTDVSFVVAF